MSYERKAFEEFEESESMGGRLRRPPIDFYWAKIVGKMGIIRKVE
jgi:hypothetical protein